MATPYGRIVAEGDYARKRYPSRDRTLALPFFLYPFSAFLLQPVTGLLRFFASLLRLKSLSGMRGDWR